jgi:hypothetical protein
MCALAVPPARAGDGPATGLDAALQNTLAGLDPDAVPTGILYDRVLPMSGLAQHSGQAAERPVTAGEWRQMLFELTRASRVVAGWPVVDQLREEARAARTDGIVPLAVLDVAYSRIRPDAMERGLLYREGAQLRPTPGLPQRELYVQARAFAAAALVEEAYAGAQVAFVLPQRLYVGDGTALGSAPAVGNPTGSEEARPRIARIELDAADGRGWRPLRWSEPAVVRYSTTGSKRLRLRVTRADGAVLQSAFVFVVRTLVTPPPTATWPLTATSAYQGVYGTGQAYVYLADGHATVTNPVVAVEGFDLDNTMNWPELYALLNQEGLLETLRADGYDAVVLNFTESTDFIQRNAMVLVELIQEVQAAAGAHDLAVVGASMGGLVARYALAYMETHGQVDHVRNFISFDGAQGGANIPLGLQYWLDFFKGQSTEAAHLLGRLDTPAARQMLVYHHTSLPGTTGQSDALRGSLQADLAAVGDWPQASRKVGVANGSGARADQGYGAGAQLISYEYTSFLVNITGNVWAVPSAASLRIFQGIIDVIWPFPDSSMSATVTGTRPWDNAPGGYRASMAQMDTTSVPYGDIVALHDNHCFIPTISALALATDDPFFDIAGAPDLLALTPFDAVYFPAANQEHVTVTPENRDWLLAEIRRAPTAVPIGPIVTAALPTRPVLYGSYPNPFNPSTTLRFSVPTAGPVQLSIYDARGQRVATLVDEVVSGGVHELVWRGVDDRGRAVASGVYRTVLRATQGEATRSLAVVR